MIQSRVLLHKGRRYDGFGAAFLVGIEAFNVVERTSEHAEAVSFGDVRNASNQCLYFLGAMTLVGYLERDVRNPVRDDNKVNDIQYPLALCGRPLTWERAYAAVDQFPQADVGQTHIPRPYANPENICHGALSRYCNKPRGWICPRGEARIPASRAGMFPGTSCTH